jgi:hypothetical protein
MDAYINTRFLASRFGRSRRGARGIEANQDYQDLLAHGASRAPLDRQGPPVHAASRARLDPPDLVVSPDRPGLSGRWDRQVRPAQ